MTAGDPVAVVRRMWDAIIEGRMDDVVRAMHGDVTIKPRARPGLSLYSGHDGIRNMGEKVDLSLGDRQIVIDDISLQVDGSVECRGHAEAATEDPGSAFTFRVVCVVRDGLVVSLESTGVND